MYFQNLRLPKMLLGKYQIYRFFLYFVLHFWNLHQILNILKKNGILIANLFPKFQTLKDLVTPRSKKHCFRTHFDSQHVKRSQKFVKSACEHYYLLVS